ncbi:MAG: F0F1 ATP synthase subunit alpha, partial [Candidatus Firestonebacteria bacterium]
MSKEIKANPEEITSVLRGLIAKYEGKLDKRNTGVVLMVGDGIARVYGLDEARYFELVEFPNNVFGIALNLERDNIGVIILGDDKNIEEGNTVKCTG